jgi:hypothetical protein
MLNDEILGTYSTPRRALDSIQVGAIRNTSGAADEARAGLPRDLRNWIFLRARHKNL